MKKAYLILAIGLLAAIASFPFLKKEMNGDNIRVSVKESTDEYKFSADFNEKQSKKVQQFMDDFLEQNTFRNAEIDADITLDDRTKFYIQLHPGEVKIKLNKSENSLESYKKIKKMGEGIKQILAGK